MEEVKAAFSEKLLIYRERGSGSGSDGGGGVGSRGYVLDQSYKEPELSLYQCQLGHGAFIFVDGIIRRNPVARSLARIF